MIVYFANRKMIPLGSASASLQSGYIIKDDSKVEDAETGVATFSLWIGFDRKTRKSLEEMTAAGNYILRSNNGRNEFYTIIDSEVNTKEKEIYVYAEDAGLDLINEIAPALRNNEAHNSEWYFNKYILDSGFEIGTNDIPEEQLIIPAWDNEETVTSRLANIAKEFGDYEVSYSFELKGLEVIKKYVNIHKKRGKDIGKSLRLNREIDNIITSSSVANLATALICEGSVPDDAEEPITLKGVTYDDGDFHIDDDGVLKSRKAVEKWSRYVWNKEPNQLSGYAGHIIRPFSYNTTTISVLLMRAMDELRKICDVEINYEIEVKGRLDDVEIGDRVNVIDEAGEMYISTRVLKIEESVVNDSYKVTLGEHIIKNGGISQKVLELAEKFKETAYSATQALATANAAKNSARDAQLEASSAKNEANTALNIADRANTETEKANNEAAAALEKAELAESAVKNVQDNVTALQSTIDNANEAAQLAQMAAEIAEKKAEETVTAVFNANVLAGEAKLVADEAHTAAENAVENSSAAITTAGAATEKANAASLTANAAKADSAQAKKDVASLGEELESFGITLNAEYTRKTDLTETAAALQSQIEMNAGKFESLVTSISSIDETTNNAQEQAEEAERKAAQAQAEADQATKDAIQAQTAADRATALAVAAQGEADAAKAAADTAQTEASEADENLAAAQADFETVKGRIDATEEEIAAAEEAVRIAQAAANAANSRAANAATVAQNAQTEADEAAVTADNAQITANQAAYEAQAAQKRADEAQGNASAAEAVASLASAMANKAQAAAGEAVAIAAQAQAAADEAVQNAAEAQEAATLADEKAAQAKSDLEAAKKNLETVSQKVDATEEEVEAAQADVERAQAAADVAAANAATAQSKADEAAAAAATAQEEAASAKTAADNAQAAAAEANEKAAQALADAGSLRIRVEKAETKIEQTSQQIALLATKAEVAAINIGGRNLIPDTDFGGVAKRYERLEGYSTEGGLYFTPTIPIENKIEYILTARIRGNANINLYQLCTWKEDENGETPTESPNISHYFVSRAALDEEEYKTFSITFKLLAGRDLTQLYICTVWGEANTFVGDWFEIEPNSLKLEKGNKATDWTPAPEDTIKAVKTAQTAAEKANAAAENLAERVTLTESSITNQAGQIALKASQTDVEIAHSEALSAHAAADDALLLAGTLEGKVTEHETAILSNANEISLRATRTEVDNIKIGGENLIANTDFGNVTKGYSRQDETQGTEGGVHFEVINRASGSSAFEYGKKYTLSARIRGTCPVDLWEINEISNVHHSWIDADEISLQYKTFSITFTASDFSEDYPGYNFENLYICSRYGEDNTPVGSYFEIEPKSLKLEEGDKATAWRPALIDTSEEIGRAQAAADEANGRVTEAEAEIKVLADTIMQLVKSDENGSLVKQTDEGVYVFDISGILSEIDKSSTASEESAAEKFIQKDVFDKTVDELKGKTDYIFTGKDEEGKPLIELGEGGSKFKVRITNEEMSFVDDGATPAKINRQMLIIENTLIKNEIQFGDDEEAGVTGVWIWKRRDNGNLGLTWKEVIK